MRVLKRRRAQTPAIPVKSELVDDEEGAGDAEQVAAEDIDDDMVPPALLEVVEHVPEGVLDELEGDRGEHDQLEVPADQRLEEPAQEVREGEQVEAGVVETGVGVGQLGLHQPAVLRVGHLFVVN
jgi:hypothetical protein